MLYIWKKFSPQVNDLMKKGLDRLLIKRFGEPDEVRVVFEFLTSYIGLCCSCHIGRRGVYFLDEVR